MNSYELIILSVFIFSMIYIIVDEIIEYFINKKLEKEYEIEKRNYNGK